METNLFPMLLISLLICLSNALGLKDRYEAYKKELLSGPDMRVLRLGDDLFSAFKASRLIGKRFDSIAFNDAMSNAFIAIFKESLEYDEKCDRVMNLCEENYKYHILNLGEKSVNDDEVKCLKKYVFPVLKDLKQLYLGRNLNDLILDNQITKIGKGSFSSLSNLKILRLAGKLMIQY